MGSVVKVMAKAFPVWPPDFALVRDYPVGARINHRVASPDDTISAAVSAERARYGDSSS
jgi:hypothetical protein